MAKRIAIPSKELQLTVVGPRDYYAAARVQRVDLSTDVPVNNIDELGNRNHAGTVTDVATTTLTFDTLDVSVKLFASLTGQDATAYPASGVDINNLTEFDAVLYVKGATTEDFVKCGSARKMQVTDFSYSYNVTGDSTESYTATGTKARWFTNDVVVDKFTTGTTSFTLSETPVALLNGDYAVSAVLDGEYLEEVAGVPATGQYRIVGTTLTTGDSRTAQLLVVYQASPAGNNWSDITDDTIPVSIRGRNAKVVISANDIPRVQSVTINGNLNSQPVQEMGNSDYVGYQSQVPTVDGSITVLDTDTELLALLTTGELTPSGVTEFSVSDLACTTSGIPLEIRLYDPCDTATIVKTVRIPQLKVTGDSYTINVNENAQTTFNFVSDTAELIIYSGAVA